MVRVQGDLKEKKELSRGIMGKCVTNERIINKFFISRKKKREIVTICKNLGCISKIFFLGVISTMQLLDQRIGTCLRLLLQVIRDLSGKAVLN